MKSMNRRFVSGMLYCLIVLIVPNQTAGQTAPQLEILSKSDATAMFALSKDAWNKNVFLAASLGIGKPIESPDGTFKMGTRHGDGIFMLVKPNYGADHSKPEFIQVSVYYPSDHSDIINDETTLKELETHTQRQMQPEYDVIIIPEEFSDGLMLCIIIHEASRTP